MSVAKSELVSQILALKDEMAKYADLADPKWAQYLPFSNLDKFHADVLRDALKWLKSIHETEFARLRSFMANMPFEYWPRFLSNPETYNKTHEWPLIKGFMRAFRARLISKSERPTLFLREYRLKVLDGTDQLP